MATTAPVEIPRSLIEDTLLGRGDNRRQLQNSPILCDVWLYYSQQLSIPADLLITSHKDTTASKLAARLYAGIEAMGNTVRPLDEDPAIAPLQTFVAARLFFYELITVVVPLTDWWQAARTVEEAKLYSANTKRGREKRQNAIDDVRALLVRWETGDPPPNLDDGRTALERFVTLCALVLLTRRYFSPTQDVAMTTAAALEKIFRASDAEIAKIISSALQSMRSPEPGERPQVYQISLNRDAAPAIARSVPAVNGDAATRVFNLQCTGINWAVVDSGIDHSHDSLPESQIKGTFDFTHYRQIVTLGNKKDSVRKKNLAALQASRVVPLDENIANEDLKAIAESAVNGQMLRWDLVRNFVEVDRPPAPRSEHGTHVAGIIGATKKDGDPESANGMCPGIGLYDFRILSAESETDITDTEFAVIAALQFIRIMNEQAGFLLINGVNLSLSIPHDVRNYACGGTPVCIECDRLIDNGVVVVAAAGNRGYKHTVSGDQQFDGYAALSITDPGNADRVITVGSTHKTAPKTYGVSYFSSRGPTGDGRLKPDLVAPGERVKSTVLGNQWRELDGTSMAAPHVSGAAAMLMSRYPELIGNPVAIKKILCDTATDLGRERNFQGHGALNVLEALENN